MSKLAKFATAFVVVAPFVAVASIPFLLDELAIKAALIQLPLWYFITGMAITVSYHRELTHGAFRMKPIPRYFWATAGSLALEGSPIWWCAKHRKHHRYTDKEGDPHSPHLSGGSVLGVLKGFLYAHCGWLFERVDPEYQKYVPDLLKDKGLVRIDRLFPLFAVLTFLLPGLVTLLFTPTLKGFAAGVFWGGFVRIFLLHHVTWSINSACHLWGTRPFRSERAEDRSTNNWLFGILGFGEGYHRGHHAFPWSARIGLRWWELDPGWIVIKVHHLLNWAEDLRVPTSQQLEAKRL